MMVMMARRMNLPLQMREDFPELWEKPSGKLQNGRLNPLRNTKGPNTRMLCFGLLPVRISLISTITMARRGGPNQIRFVQAKKSTSFIFCHDLLKPTDRRIGIHLARRLLVMGYLYRMDGSPFQTNPRRRESTPGNDES